MKRVLWVGILTFTTQAFAVPATPVPLVSAPGATPAPIGTFADATGLSPVVVDRLRATVFQINDRVAESRCAVSPITPDGYLLTALHCLRRCLLNADRAERTVNKFIGLQDFFVVRDPAAPGAVCEDLDIPALRVTGGVQVVATGPALTMSEPMFLSDYPTFANELRARKWSLQSNDFAILKVQVPRTLRCLKLSSSAVAAGADVWSVGFPPGASAKDVPLLSSSHGQRFARVEDSQTYRTQVDDRGRAWARELFGESGLIFSSAANAEGQSGGPVIDAAGRVVGVTSGFGVPVGSRTAAEHELFAPSMGAIVRGLPADLAAQIVRANAACE